jgi:hypothetical protein
MNQAANEGFGLAVGQLHLPVRENDPPKMLAAWPMLRKRPSDTGMRDAHQGRATVRGDEGCGSRIREGQNRRRPDLVRLVPVALVARETELPAIARPLRDRSVA